ncbi:chemotaxis protein CheW [Rhodopseudomonas palustris]|uniref:Chemotaxis protein CheW n=1 Tax=Rhodopseudomonas palustris (strain BisB18) TaxID=316056 RepID=Q20XK2_RHOPB
MAKRAQHAAATSSSAAPAAAPAGDAARAPSASHVVVFGVAAERLGLRLEQVAEIIRPPKLAKMPMAPPSLLGLANLRGTVLPVLSLRRLLGWPDASAGDTARVIVIDRAAPFGLLVDRIDRLLRVADDAIAQDDAGAGQLDPGLLEGVIKGGEGRDTIKVVHPDRLLRDQFARLSSAGPRAAAGVAVIAGAAGRNEAAQHRLALLSFDLGAQEYALPLERVLEIIALPPHVSEVPRPETAVLGVVTLRDRLLPLVSLRTLLGFPDDLVRDGRAKVIVLSLGQGAVGVVVDRTRDILRVDPALIDPAPALLTRGEGDAEIAAICRLDHGRRLVGLLSADRLFRSELVSRVLSQQQEQGSVAGHQAGGDAVADEQFIVFRLGEQDYGVPVAAIDEVARAPERVTRLPKAPAFIDGVMNLRGRVMPIVDLRRRFELAANQAKTAQRVLVLDSGGGKTGFLVDSVSELIRLPAHAISAAPEVSADQARLIHRVANLEADGRIILLIDPAQLLDRVEADVLAKFARSRPDAALPAS